MTEAEGAGGYRGTCYGYEIHSALDFRFLRTGSGQRLLVEAEAPPDRPPGELLREWTPPFFPTHVRLHQDADGYRLWIEGAGWFGVDPDRPRLTVPPGGDPLRREERLLGLPILLCFLDRGDVPVHAACVEVEGRALLLAAPREFGKTTLAAAFAESGHRVLAEDLTCLRPGQTPAVVPGPAMLRVRPDVAERFGPGSGRELRRDDERSHRRPGGDGGTCDPVPLAGIVLLNEADTDPRLERVPGAEATRNLWAVSFNLPDDGDRARCFRDVSELAAAVPAWRLERRLRLDELGRTVELLEELVRRETRGTGAGG